MKHAGILMGAVAVTLSACSSLPPQPLEAPERFSVSGQASNLDTGYNFQTRDGLTLVAKLTMPAHATHRVPVAIFMGGSGTWDSDYSSLTADNQLTSLMSIPSLAREIAQVGIAFIRYQKRGVTDPGGLLTAQWKTAQLDNLLADAQLLLAKVKADPRLDGSRIALIGHSEGTMIASWVGGSDPAVKAFVLMGIVRRNLKDVYRYQLVNRNGEAFFAFADAHPKDGYLDPTEIERARTAGMRFDNWRAADSDHDGRLSKDEYMALLNGLYDEWTRNIEQAKPEVLVPGNGSPAGWFQQHFRHPTVGEVWQHIKTSVLVIQGKSDTNTPVQTEAEPFEAMLCTRQHPDHQLVELEGLDHLFRDRAGTSHAEQAYAKILPWLKQHLKVN